MDKLAADRSIWSHGRLLGLFFMAMAFLPVFPGAAPRSTELNIDRAYEAGSLLIGATFMAVGLRSLSNVRTELVHRWALLPLAFCLWAIGSASWSVAPALTVSKSLEFLTVVAGSLLFLYWLDQTNSGQIDLAGYLTKILLLVIGLGLALNVLYWGTPLATTTGERNRLFLAFAHPGTTGGFFALTIICCATSRMSRPTKLTIMGLGLVLLILTDSRMTMAAVPLALYAIFLTRLGRLSRLFAILNALAALLAYILYGMIAWRGDPLHQIRPMLPEDLDSLNGRIGLWNYSYELIGERPITGFGYYGSRYILLERFPWAGNLHNGVLEILLSTGAVGLLLTIAFAIQVAWLAWQTHSRLLLGLWVYMLVIGITSAVWMTPSLDNVILLVAFGAAARQYFRDSSEAASDGPPWWSLSQYLDPPAMEPTLVGRTHPRAPRPFGEGDRLDSAWEEWPDRSRTHGGAHKPAENSGRSESRRPINETGGYLKRIRHED